MSPVEDGGGGQQQQRRDQLDVIIIAAVALPLAVEESHLFGKTCAEFGIPDEILVQILVQILEYWYMQRTCMPDELAARRLCCPVVMIWERGTTCVQDTRTNTVGGQVGGGRQVVAGKWCCDEQVVAGKPYIR